MVMFGNRWQVGGQLVSRTQHSHGAGRKFPHQPLLVRDLVLTIVERKDLRHNAVTVEEAAVRDLE